MHVSGAILKGGKKHPFLLSHIIAHKSTNGSLMKFNKLLNAFNLRISSSFQDSKAFQIGLPVRFQPDCMIKDSKVVCRSRQAAVVV